MHLWPYPTEANRAWTKLIGYNDKNDNLGDEYEDDDDDDGDDVDDDDDDMFLHHYIVDKVSRGHKTGLPLHNTMLKSNLFVQFVQIYPHHDSPFCSTYANLSMMHFLYDAVFFCVNVK